MSEATGRPAPQEFENVLTGAAATVASFDEEHLTVLQRTQRFLHAYPTVVPFVVLLLGVLLGVLVNPSRFTAASNFSTILTQVMVIGIVGVGQTLVILTAGIDLSVGVIMVISSVVMGRFAVYDGVPTIDRLPARAPCRRSLRLSQWDLGHAAQDAAVHRHARNAQHHRRAQHLLFAERNDRDAGHRGQGLVPADHGQSGGDRRRPHHVGHLPVAVVAAVVWYVLNRTAYGRHIYATGDDPEAARLAGINTDRILLSVYVLAGLIAAIAGWALIGRVGAISPTAGENANLDSITAVVIGGTVAVRRQRVDHRHAGRRADRRRLPLRRFPRRARRALAGVRYRRPDHRRGRARPVDPEGVEMSVEPVLLARSLVKRYGRVTALDHADFELFPGEILAVIGDNGAGKSTLIKALCGAVIPDSARSGLVEKSFTSPRRSRRAKRASRPCIRLWLFRRRCRSPTTCSSAGSRGRLASWDNGSERPIAPAWRNSRGRN